VEVSLDAVNADDGIASGRIDSHDRIEASGNVKLIVVEVRPPLKEPIKVRNAGDSDFIHGESPCG
jgi:hypothetical protein